MEAMILDDIMRMVTMMKTNPHPKLSNLIKEMNDKAKEDFSQQEKREKEVDWSWLKTIQSATSSVIEYFYPSNQPKALHLKNRGFREKLEEIEEREVIHPTKIFDMIATP